MRKLFLSILLFNGAILSYGQRPDTLPPNPQGYIISMEPFILMGKQPQVEAQFKEISALLNSPHFTPDEFKEINQLGIVQQTSVSYPYVDQAISLNLNFDPNDSPKWISQVHKEAWKLGIKTLYYMRTESVLRGDTLSRMDDCIACHA